MQQNQVFFLHFNFSFLKLHSLNPFLSLISISDIWINSGSFTFNIKKVGGATLKSQTEPVASGFTSTRRTDWGYGKKLDEFYTVPQEVKVYDNLGNLVETLSPGTPLVKIQAGPAVINYGGSSGCNFVTSGEFYVTQNYYSYIGEQYGTCFDTFILPPTASGINRNLYTLPTSNLVNTLFFEQFW
jgi:hypothetical protein